MEEEFIISSIQKFTYNQIEAISQILGDATTGSQITGLLSQVGINDADIKQTKWRRINFWLKQIQDKQDSPNNIIQFIKVAVEPSRFMEDPEGFKYIRSKLNTVLLLNGLQINEAGNIDRARKAETLDQACIRANELKQKLFRRAIHSTVLKFCEPEYLQQNYFHAVFEAVKSILERIRGMTDLKEDGVSLVVKSFDEKKPKISFNMYSNESQKNELMGLRSLIIGLIKMVRNTHAHEAKINWVTNELDALDILTMVSYVHRRLDDSYKTFL